MKNKHPFSSSRSRLGGQGVIYILLLFILFGNVFFFGYKSYEMFNLNNEDEELYLKKVAIIKNKLDDNYLYSNEVDQQRVFDGAIKGMVLSMGDPYTRYVSQRDYEDFKIQTEGQFGGIGVTINTEKSASEGGLVLSNTEEGNSAQIAGLKPNDKIIKVNGEDIEEMEIRDAIALIRGDIGTTVILTILREGEDEPIEIKVKRSKVEIEVIGHQMLDNDIGYIRYGLFSRVSVEQFDKAFQELKENGAKGLILDLRGNSGGLVQASQEIASRLIGENEPLVEISSKNHSTMLKTTEAPYKIDIPVLVLVNKDTASASEILAGVLKDNNYTIMGTTTYGKGLIQDTFPVDSESALIITISEYITPKGEYIHRKGVDPNIEVEIDKEDLLKGIDTQLNEAINQLETEINQGI